MPRDDLEAPAPQIPAFDPNPDPMVSQAPDAPEEPKPEPEGPTPWQSLSSSNVRRARYNPDTETLDVQFHSGRTYHYRGVPLDVYDGLVNAGSPGRYVHGVLSGYEFNR